MNSTLQASGYQNLLAANGLTQNVRHFDGLFTQIAISENGYIAIYYHYIPADKKGVSEQLEKLEVLHISQINDFDIDIEDIEKTKVKRRAFRDNSWRSSWWSNRRGNWWGGNKRKSKNDH